MQQKYQKLLRKSIQSTFEEWKKREAISEKELYRFLHKLKGTSGTIGLSALSEFCASQLAILSSEEEGLMPINSLTTFKNKLLDLASQTDDASLSKITSSPLNSSLLESSLFLFIDDDLEFVSYVKEYLEQRGAQVVIALDGKRGVDKFYSVRPTVVVVNVNLPDITGFDVLAQIAGVARARYISVIMASADNSRDNKIKAYKLGALDFIRKPFDMEIFVPYVVNREEMRKKIDESVVTDGLTGVGNRRYFDEMLRHFSELNHRKQTPFSLVMLDLDHFKKVNDQYGHLAGDEVLRKLGEIALAEKRESDYVFRYGGEEFAIITTNNEGEQIQHLVSRIRKTFSAIKFEANGEMFSVNFSAGIAPYKGSITEVISNADQALYRAKRTGRNKTVVYHADTAKITRKLHVIIVDDDALMRSMIRSALTELSVPDVELLIHDYRDGPSFLESDWYKQEENHIILLDGIMPVMDGLEVLGRVKNTYDTSNVIVAMMTARTSESDIKAALWLGADDYIMKPFSQKEVRIRVEQLIQRLQK